MIDDFSIDDASRAGALLQGLAGDWILVRRIAALSDTPDLGSASGSARFTPSEGGLDYLEEGEMVLGDSPPSRFARRYRYAVEEGRIAIRFADGPDIGKLFVPLAFQPSAGGAVGAEAVHLCDPDRYEVAMTLLPGLVSMAVTVTGPAKAHRIETVLTRPD
ncbi:MAG: DUF6314 family protein [Alphaproteobacteria bacterium]|nr:DUF6314 family protein [Alphaproteobacteria bacterium]